MQLAETIKTLSQGLVDSSKWLLRIRTETPAPATAVEPPPETETPAETPKERIHCHWPYTTLFVNLDDTVGPCCFNTFGRIEDGDLNEIWNSPAAQNTRRKLNEGDMVGAGCGQCGFRGRRDIETFPRTEDRGQSPEIISNIQIQRKEYAAGSEVLESLPTHVVVQATEACNIRCVMCFQDHQAKHITDSAWDKVMKHADVYDQIHFTGGEPFLSKKVLKYLDEFNTTSGQMLSFTTNGLLLETFKTKLEKLSRLHLDISVDGATKPTYEKVRLLGSWDKLVGGMAWYTKQVSERPLWDKGRVAYVIMKSNYEEIPKFIEWAKGLGMPVLFAPVWGSFAPGENIFEQRELMDGLTPPSQMLQRADAIASGMSAEDRAETMRSLEYSLQVLA